MPTKRTKKVAAPTSPEPTPVMPEPVVATTPKPKRVRVAKPKLSPVQAPPVVEAPQPEPEPIEETPEPTCDVCTPSRDELLSLLGFLNLATGVVARMAEQTPAPVEANPAESAPLPKVDRTPSPPPSDAPTHALQKPTAFKMRAGVNCSVGGHGEVAKVK